MSNSSAGYFCLPRELTRGILWQELDLIERHIFLTIYDYCVFETKKMNDHGVIIELQPLQFLTTYRDLLELCNLKEISKGKLERSLSKFFLIGFSRQEVRHVKTLITITEPSICNLHENINGTRNGTRSRQDRDKIETESNKIRSKQEKKKEINKEKVREWVELTKIEFDTLIEKHGTELANEMLDILDAFNTSKQKHYASDYGAMKTQGWVHREALKRRQPTNGYSAKVDRRTKNMDGTPVETPHLKDLF